MPLARLYHPGTTVYGNKFDIRDVKVLAEIERLFTTARSNQGIPTIELTPEGYARIHKHLFQDVYEWAGQLRGYRTVKGQNSFAWPQFIASQLARQFKRLNAENNLQGLPLDRFVERAAEHINEINAIHPFPDGNGRAQRALLEEVSRRAGFELRIRDADKARWIPASIAGFDGDNQPMVQLLRDCTRARA